MIMRMFLAAAAATMLTTAAFAADPMAPPASGATCAQLITQAKGMTLPSDATKAQSVKDELAAAEAAGDDATCKTHANNALNILSGM